LAAGPELGQKGRDIETACVDPTSIIRTPMRKGAQLDA